MAEEKKGVACQYFKTLFRHLPREIEGNKRSLGLCIKQYEIRELG
jgi:hypothetical protein